MIKKERKGRRKEGCNRGRKEVINSKKKIL